MAHTARQPAPAPLDPALLRIVEAMARAQAQRDYRDAQGLPEPGR